MSVIVFSLLRAVLYLSVSQPVLTCLSFLFLFNICDWKVLMTPLQELSQILFITPFNPPFSPWPVSGPDYNQAWPGLWWTSWPGELSSSFSFYIELNRQLSVCLAECCSGLVNCWNFLVQVVVIDWTGGSIRTINTWISWQFCWQQGDWGGSDLWCQLVIPR